MKREDLLRQIRELGGIESRSRAELILWAVAEAFDGGMTSDEMRGIVKHSFNRVRLDHDRDVGHPSGILEKEEMMFDPGVKH